MKHQGLDEFYRLVNIILSRKLKKKKDFEETQGTIITKKFVLFSSSCFTLCFIFSRLPYLDWLLTFWILPLKFKLQRFFWYWMSEPDSIFACVSSQTTLKCCLLFQVPVQTWTAENAGLYKNESTGVRLGWCIRAELSWEQTHIQNWNTEERRSPFMEHTMLSFFPYCPLCRPQTPVSRYHRHSHQQYSFHNLRNLKTDDCHKDALAWKCHMNSWLSLYPSVCMPWWDYLYHEILWASQVVQW